MIGKFLTAASAVTMIAAPVAAAPTNPAASLSVAPRTSTSTGKANDLAGASVPALLIFAGIAAIGVIAVVNETEDNDFPDSN